MSDPPYSKDAGTLWPLAFEHENTKILCPSHLVFAAWAVKSQDFSYNLTSCLIPLSVHFSCSQVSVWRARYRLVCGGHNSLLDCQDQWVLHLCPCACWHIDYLVERDFNARSCVVGPNLLSDSVAKRLPGQCRLHMSDLWFACRRHEFPDSCPSCPREIMPVRLLWIRVVPFDGLQLLKFYELAFGSLHKA